MNDIVADMFTSYLTTRVRQGVIEPKRWQRMTANLNWCFSSEAIPLIDRVDQKQKGLGWATCDCDCVPMQSKLRSKEERGPARGNSLSAPHGQWKRSPWHVCSGITLVHHVNTHESFRETRKSPQMWMPSVLVSSHDSPVHVFWCACKVINNIQ